MFAATTGGGSAFGFPDTCKTPAPPSPSPVPIPYPNIAMFNMANSGTCSMKVKILNMPVITKASIIPLSSGDEAGVAGGVVSGMNLGQAAFKMGVMTVKVEGNDIINHLKTVAQNGSNANVPAGMHLVPSQTTVLVNG